MVEENTKCYFDIEQNGVSKGRILMQVFNQKVPKTAQNFINLCIGDSVDESGTNLSYLNSCFHRVIKGFMIQGGDFTAGDGTGGASIYGSKFDDESFELKHDKAGLLSMANSGPNTNGSQFFITCKPTPHLDGKHVVFGSVIKGMNVVRAIENCEKGSNDRPLHDIKIVKCGVLGNDEDDGIPIPSDGDLLVDYPEDHELLPEENADKFLSFGADIKAIGNIHLKAGLANKNKESLEKAREKYMKAIRYIESVDPTPESSKDLSLEYKNTFFALKIACLSNHSMASLQLQDYAAALHSAQRIIGLVPTLEEATKLNPEQHLQVPVSDQGKAYFRVGTSLFHMGDNEASLTNLEKALKLIPEDGGIQRMIMQVKRGMKQDQLKQKAMYKKMFE